MLEAAHQLWLRGRGEDCWGCRGHRCTANGLLGWLGRAWEASPASACCLAGPAWSSCCTVHLVHSSAPSGLHPYQTCPPTLHRHRAPLSACAVPRDRPPPSCPALLWRRPAAMVGQQRGLPGHDRPGVGRAVHNHSGELEPGVRLWRQRQHPGRRQLRAAPCQGQMRQHPLGPSRYRESNPFVSAK